MNNKHDDQALLDFARELFDVIGWPKWLRFDKPSEQWYVIGGGWDGVNWATLYIREARLELAARFIRDYLREKLEEKGYGFELTGEGRILAYFYNGHSMVRRYLTTDGDTNWRSVAKWFTSMSEALITVARVVFMGGE